VPVIWGGRLAVAVARLVNAMLGLEGFALVHLARHAVIARHLGASRGVCPPHSSVSATTRLVTRELRSL